LGVRPRAAEARALGGDGGHEQERRGPDADHRRVLSGPPRLGQATPVDLGLDVADSVAVELDLDLMVLDVPAVHGREPAEPPLPVRHDTPPAVDEGTAAWRAETLALLRVGPAKAEDLVVRRLARRDARERLARDDCPGIVPGGSAARPEVNASLN